MTAASPGATLQPELDRVRRAVLPLAPLQVTGRTSLTSAWSWVVVAALVLLPVYERVQERTLLLLGVVLGAVALADLALRPRLGGLSVADDTGDNVRVGELRRGTLLVRNTGTARTPPCLARCELPGHEPVTVALPALAPRERLEVPLERRALHRGTTPVSVVRLRARSPLGFLVAVRDDVLSGDELLRVWPEAVPAPALRPAAVASAAAARHSDPRPGSGIEIYGLRPWRHGDGSGAVSARATARHGRPIVLEREREVDARLVLLVGGGGAGPAWESAVARAAALGVAAARAGQPVVVQGLASTAQWSATAVLDALADADAAEPLDESAVRRAVRTAGPDGRLVLLAPAQHAAERSQARRIAAAARCELVVLDG